MTITVCAWCESERILGNQTDAGHPLTNSEAAGGFFAAHAGCRPKMDGLFARLAATGVFVDVEGGETRASA